MIQRYKLIDELSPLREFKYAVWNYSKPSAWKGFVYLLNPSIYGTYSAGNPKLFISFFKSLEDSP